MKQQSKPIIYENGKPLEAQLVMAQCEVGPQTKELWKVMSPVFHNVCHMCCFRHRRAGCIYRLFSNTTPCMYYNLEFGFTHFFQELQQPIK